MDAAVLKQGGGDEAPYVELHLHTNYSLLEGASHPEELIDRAIELGYDALAISDHDNLYGAMAFAQACKARGIRPITGVELTVAEDPDQGSRDHLVLLAESRRGYGNLCRLVSLASGHDLPAQADRERRRRDPCLPLARLAGHADGLICLAGCRGGELARLATTGHAGTAEAILRRLIGWFGPESVFVELQDNLVHGDGPRDRALAALAARCGVGVVATGDVHYHDRARHRLQDALVAIKHCTTLDASHRLRRPNSEFFLRAPEEQAARFAAFATAVANARRIADRCAFDLAEELDYRLPTPPVPEGHTPDSWLAELCRRALREKYASHERPAAEARLAEELGLIARHELAGFFLVYHEVLELAREVAAEVRGSAPRGRTSLPPGRGRGSSVGSIVCYLIGLSHIDPVRNRLFLGRFLNEEMQSLPDIDLDFPRDIRERLFERVYERWGADHAALVATFPTYRIRSAIRDLGKALGLPPREVDRLAKFAESYGSARDVREEMLRAPGFSAGGGLADAPGWRELVELAGELADFPRHLSQHVGGVVIASDPLVECVPVQPAAWPGRYVCHWDKDSVDDARMVKIDFLALGMLSHVEECLDLVAEHRGVLVDLSRIDFGDERVYDRICSGDTVGVFQIESRAQAQMLPRTRPRSLDDLATEVAIVRPGPIVGGAVNPYVRRREAQRQDPAYVPEVPHECVREALEETLGVVLFQEQVIQVAMAMGGFSAGEAEGFRRSMSRKRSRQAMAAYEERFISGAVARGVLRETAEAVFQSLLGFAEFGFPKSHAVAFALLAYQSAWLKEYYPVEFYCALYNNWPMGFYPPHVFTNDARRHGVEVLRPDINRSAAKCTVEGDAVRIGLGYAQGVGRAGTAAITAERARVGPYRSLSDLAHRTGLRREAVESLVRVGAFDEFGLNRRELLWQLGLQGPGLVRARLSGPSPAHQLRLALPTEQDEVPLEDFTPYERMAADYEVLGLSPDSHPMKFLRLRLGEGVRSSRHLQALEPGQVVDVAGLVVCRQRPSTAKGIVFLLLEDEFGMVNVLVPSKLYERERVAVRTSPFLRVRGLLEGHAGQVPMVHARALRPLTPDAALLTPEGKSWG